MKDADDLTVYLKGQECKLSFHRYAATGRTMLRLRDAAHGDHVDWATTIHPLDLATDEKTLVIVDYPGKSGLLQALEMAGAVRATGEHVKVGSLKLPLAQLLVNPRLPPRDRPSSLKDLVQAAPGKQDVRRRDIERER